MIDDSVFNPEAPLDMPVRHRHNCSNKTDQTLVVTRTSNGWLYVCHRCGLRGKKPLKGLPPSMLIKWHKSLEQKSNHIVPEMLLPSDYTGKLPTAAKVWLYHSGLDDYDILYYRIGYSPSLKRVILPVYEDGSLIFWQGRLLEDDKSKPKYINIRKSTRKNIYFRNELRKHQTDSVVIVEDILSAIKVGKVTNTIALLGSYVPDDLIRDCSVHYKTIFIWLDFDKACYNSKTSLRARSFGYNCKSIVTKFDPKNNSLDEIRGKVL